MLCAVMALFSCSQSELADMEGSQKAAEDSTPVNFNISVNEEGVDGASTRAIKSAWATGDVIYIKFKGINTKFMTITYNGTTWDAQAYDNSTPIATTTFVASDFSGIDDADKVLGAIHFPIAVTPRWNQNNGLSFGDEEDFLCHHLYQSEAAYTVDGANVNITLSLQKRDNVVLFHIPGIQANASAYTLKITGEGVTDKIPSISAIAQNGQVTISSTSGDYIFNRGIADADGAYFAVYTNPGTEKTYTFTVTGPDQAYTKTSTVTLQSGYQYNLKALNDASWTPKFHVFSVAANKTVHIAPGNLVAHYTGYTGSKWIWTFAKNQYSRLGTGGQNQSISTDVKLASSPYARTSGSGDVDLFGWSTSATYYGIAKSTDESKYSGDFVDWGNNVIGCYAANTWRTPTGAEWSYLFNTRSTTSGKRYAKATVNSKQGVILLPDDWSTSYHSLSSTNTSYAEYTANSISSTVWTNDFEAHGAVFLPAAGFRTGTTVLQVGEIGYYWSSSTSESNSAKSLTMRSTYLQNSDVSRNSGQSIRLVRDAN